MKLLRTHTLHTRLSIGEFTVKGTLETFYLLLFAGYAALNLLSGTPLPFGLIFKVYQYVAIAGLLTLFVLKNRVSLKRMALITVIAVIFFIIAQKTGKPTLILSGLFVAFAGFSTFDRIVKVSLISTLPTLLFIVACSKVGIIPDHVFLHEGKVAHSLGFSYYGTVPYIVLFCMIGYLYLRGKKIGWFEIFCMVAVNFLVYKVSTTRLAFFLFFVIIALFIFLIKLNIIKDLNRPVYKFLAALGFPLVFGVTIWISLSYIITSPFWRKVDDFSSKRVMMSNRAFSMYDVKLFGQYIEMHGNGYGDNGIYFYIDSGYVYTLLGNGLLFTVILLLVYSFMMWASCRMNKKELFVWLAAIMAFSMINNVFTNITYNSAFMAFIPLLNYMVETKRSPTEKLFVKYLGKEPSF